MALVRPSVCRVCHTRDPRLNGSTYRNALWPYDRAMLDARSLSVVAELVALTTARKATASCILMSIQVRRTCAIERLHYNVCTPHMRFVFSMFETTHMYDVHVRWVFTLWYMYAVHVLWCKHRLKLLQFSMYNVLHHLQVLLITRVKTAVIYINNSKNVVSDQRGTSYIRWGRKTCQGNAARVYRGMTTAFRSVHAQLRIPV